MFKRKQRKTENGIEVPDYPKLHVKMLLYRSRAHFNCYVGLRMHPDVKIVLDTGSVVLPTRGLWGHICKNVLKCPDGIYPLHEKYSELAQSLPDEIDSFGFDEAKFIEICQKYSLYDSEKEAGQCPFCRIFPGACFMKVISNSCEEGSLARGGLWAPCIHLLWSVETGI